MSPALRRGAPLPWGPLGRVRVSDFTWARAGPQATRILAMCGAEVLRIEWPENPDIIRLGSPRHTPRGMTPGLNTNADFNNFNCNKLGVTINLKSAAGLELVQRLIAVSDALIENFSAGVLERWGLGYERVRRLNPAIVYVSMAGFGHSGRYRDYVTWGPAVQAMSGLTFLSGFPGMQPAGWGHSYMDHTSGYYAALAMLAALRHRNRTGAGQHIDLAQVDVGCTMTGAAQLDFTVNGRPTGRDGVPPGNRTHWPGSALTNTYRGRHAAPHNAYQCAGGGHNDWVAIACFTADEWRGLVQAMGSPVWAGDVRFSTLLGRLKHQDELDELIGGWTIGLDKYEVTRRLQAAGVPSAPVQGMDDRLVRDPQLAHRGTFVQRASHPVIGDQPFEGLPMRMRGAQWKVTRSGPLMGEDNRHVVCDVLGRPETDYLRLNGEGVFWPQNMQREEAP